MKRQFRLPDPGEGLVEAEIVAWRVTVGEIIEVNDVLVEIETSKSLVELPSPFAGEVTGLLVEEGSTVEVGTPIVEIDDGEDAPEAENVGGAQPNLVGYGASDSTPSRRRRTRRTDRDPEVTQALSDSYEPHEPSRRPDEVQPAGHITAQAVGDPLPGPGVGPSRSELVLASDPHAVRAKPPVRKYARDLDVDLASVVGTGPDGTITRRDVEAALAWQMLRRRAASSTITPASSSPRLHFRHRPRAASTRDRSLGSHSTRGLRRTRPLGVSVVCRSGVCARPRQKTWCVPSTPTCTSRNG